MSKQIYLKTKYTEIYCKGLEQRRKRKQLEFLQQGNPSKISL